MKKLFILSALFIGISAFSFCQTTVEAVVVYKQQVYQNIYIYFVKNVNTGLDYISLPTQAQSAIGEYAEWKLVTSDNRNRFSNFRRNLQGNYKT